MAHILLWAIPLACVLFRLYRRGINDDPDRGRKVLIYNHPWLEKYVQFNTGRRPVSHREAQYGVGGIS